jgi:phosphomannomutase
MTGRRPQLGGVPLPGRSAEQVDADRGERLRAELAGERADRRGDGHGHGATVPDMSPDVDVLLARARAWIAEDPDPHTRAELEQVITDVEGGDAAASADLADRFRGTLEFGTAGLRGALGAGPYRMNRVVVTRAAAGLAAYLRAQDDGSSGQQSVVIGYDARHGSDVFARDTAEVMTGAGFTAWVMPRPLPTPVLAFAIRELGCAAGVMVTASHNPPQDNGYKVYLGDGSQIVPPADSGIAERIEAVGSLADVPRGDGGRVLGEDIVDHYLDTAAALAGDGPRDLDIVYTPLHGVGGTSVLQVLETAGFSTPRVVEQQEQPDPDFPTVGFPNPEEPGAMDLALELAERSGADLVVANDPDADRCAAAVPVDGAWRMLRGDEVGALLAHHLLAAGRTGTYASSIVSSSLLGKQAAAAGQPYVETLTGFKWIGRLPGLAFGYEEALGYCVDPEHVRDKDGVSALLMLCELAASLKAEGRTLVDLLDDIAREHGLHATDQASVRVADLDLIPAAMARLREHPPTELGGLAVLGVDDLSLGSESLPPTDGLRYRLADGARVIVRPSGTEPKIKCYLEVVVPVEADADDADDPVAAARIAAAGRLDALGTDIRAAAGI